VHTLQHILQHTTPLQIVGDSNVLVSTVVIDSRAVVAQACFIAIKGSLVDGHAYIDKAIAQGATSIVCEALPTNINNNVCYVVVPQANVQAGNIAALFYEQPSAQLKVCGVTGTNGKTTCATLAHQLFTQLGFVCGLISTVHNVIGKQVIPSTHTTPDAVSVQALLAQMVQAGCSYVFMEVSSHAAHQYRIQGIQFAAAIFTNITHDHLDYHGTFDNYIAAKKMFFDGLTTQSIAITNIDDKRGAVMLQNTAAKKISYSLKTMADYKGKLLENSIEGLLLDINNTQVHCRLLGAFNAYNLLAVYALAIELGQLKEEVLPIISNITGAVGRFEVIKSKQLQVLGIVDYAHTPDALLNVLATINQLKNGTEQVLTLVGCGGDRDKTKRPVMASVACEHSSQVIFTSDNPRTEDAAQIIKEMEAGVPPHQARKYLSIPDRQEAIKAICKMAKAKDIILIAGKGHEDYQEINGIKHPFDDKLILTQTFELLNI
jgi:UDP-N-acetylmuramoyl-L-alanyl-D-glutamate--2,6-diaminopimelate ligase